MHAPFPRHRPTEVVYQVYPATFADSNHDGHGDLAGITQRLDYIKSLNVDAVWISPFYPAPEGRDGDGGYAVSDYRGVDPKYGTLDDFKDLLRGAHKRGLRIYTDFVLAHTAFTHDWFEKSRNRVPGFEDRYVWHDGHVDEKGLRHPPNNWKSVFGGPAWRWDDVRGQYYLHHFLASQPALNLNAMHVQDAVLDEMKFWLDMGVDGFRLDALPFCNHDPEYRHNDWLSGQCPFSLEHEYWDQQYFNASMNPDATVEFVSRIRALADGYARPKTILGEVIAGLEGGRNSIPVAAKFVDRFSGAHACYTEALMGVYEYPTARRIKDMITAIEHHFPDGGNCNAASNHDIPRSASRMTQGLPESERQAAARQLMRLYVMLPGSFCMYQGEELGLPQATPQDVPLSLMRDAVALTRGEEHSRDRQRTPLPWHSEYTNAGFTTAWESHLPIARDHYPLAVDCQDNDPGSFLNMTRRLLAWRAAQPALAQGSTIALDAPEPVLLFLRRHAEQTMLCAFNFSRDAREVDLTAVLDDALRAQLGVGTHLRLDAYGAQTHGDLEPERAVRPQWHVPQRAHGPRVLVHA